MALLPASQPIWHYNHCGITSTSLLQPPGGITPHSLAVLFFSFRLMSMEFYPLAFKFPYFSFQYCCQTFFSCTIVLPFCGIIHLPFFGITFSLFPTCWPGPLVMLCMGSCLDHQGTSSPLSTSELTSHAKVGHR